MGERLTDYILRIFGRVRHGFVVTDPAGRGEVIPFTTSGDLMTGDGTTTPASGFVPTSRTITAGAGLTGGGDLSANRTLDVGAGTGITVNANDVALDTTHVRNVDHTAVTLTAGAGLTGGGDISASRTFNVGAGSAIDVAADAVNVKVDGVTIQVNGSNQLETVSTGGAYMPLTTGAEPMEFVSNGAGAPMMLAFTP